MCRSELAREKLLGTAVIQPTSVIVDDFREQARSYTKPGPIGLIGGVERSNPLESPHDSRSQLHADGDFPRQNPRLRVQAGHCALHPAAVPGPLSGTDRATARTEPGANQ
ncbi:hypothetical protein METHPM2_270034 [Pseudomonas sp. PM2]